MTLPRAVLDEIERLLKNEADEISTSALSYRHCLGHIAAFAIEQARQDISAQDRRWRFLEHGCQWVSWTPTGGETVSFDPRDVKYLKAMRDKADETSAAQVKLLREEAAKLAKRFPAPEQP